MFRWLLPISLLVASAAAQTFVTAPRGPSTAINCLGDNAGGCIGDNAGGVILPQ